MKLENFVNVDVSFYWCLCNHLLHSTSCTHTRLGSIALWITSLIISYKPSRCRGWMTSLAKINIGDKDKENEAWSSFYPENTNVVVIFEFRKKKVIATLLLRILCRNLDQLLISLYFTSKQPNTLVIFKVLLSNSPPGFLKVFQHFSLDTGYSVQNVQVQNACTWAFSQECFCLLSQFTLASEQHL